MSSILRNNAKRSDITYFHVISALYSSNNIHLYFFLVLYLYSVQIKYDVLVGINGGWFSLLHTYFFYKRPGRDLSLSLWPLS